MVPLVLGASILLALVATSIGQRPRFPNAPPKRSPKKTLWKPPPQPPMPTRPIKPPPVARKGKARRGRRPIAVGKPRFTDLDADGDGQVGLAEWLKAGRPRPEFDVYDADGDGLITAEEVRALLGGPSEIRLDDKGHASYRGSVEQQSEPYHGKRSYKSLDVRLQNGRTYVFELQSKEFQSYIALEDADGTVLKQSSSPNVGGKTTLSYRPENAGRYRVIATSQGGFRSGAFELTVHIESGFVLKGLPKWFKELDADRDGQITLREWRQAKRPRAEFDALDADGDGLITAQEVLSDATTESNLRMVSGRGRYSGTLDESPDEPYRGLRCYRVFHVWLVEGITYEFEVAGKDFPVFLFIEMVANGQVLAFSFNRVKGNTSRLVFRARQTDTYRLIATSMGGQKSGPIVLSANVRAPGAAGGLPAWFKTFDRDGDGQVSLFEWRAGRRKIAEFAALDGDGDGLLTADEAGGAAAAADAGLRLDAKGHGQFRGTVEETDEPHRGKRSYKTFDVPLRGGRTYIFEMRSKEFQSYLSLEDDEGTVLKQHSSPNVGGLSRLVYRVERTGMYRLTATSLGGFRTGAFELTVRIESPFGGL